MKRRDLLEATGLATMVDLGAAAGSAAGASDGAVDGASDGAAGEAVAGSADDAGAPDVPYESFLARLPPLDAPARGRGYDATFARRFDGRYLADPDLLAGADAHASLVASRATVTVGFGGPDRDAAVEHLEGRGYRRGDRVAGRPVYERRGRRKHRAVVAGEDAVLVGVGPAPGPVLALLEAAAEPERPTSPYETRPPVRRAVDLLAGGTAFGVELGPGLSSGPADALRSGARSADALVTGERLTVRGDRVGVRSVAVYPTRTAAGRALRGRSGIGGTATRDGRAVVRDGSAPASDLLPEGGA